jgi:hypothetical protein
MALRGTKLQTGLSRVLVVWMVIYVIMVVILRTCIQAGFVACTIFWAGAFLSWFGVRSHIESSILMRMMYLLRRRAMKAEELLGDYQSHYGEEMRFEELARGNMIQRGDEIQVTSKGRFILRMVALLR